MSTDKGYIRLYRNIWDNWVWTKDRHYDKAHAWIDMLLKANHEKKKVSVKSGIIVVDRGQFFTSFESLMDRWGWNSKHTVTTFLNNLENDGMITTKRNADGTLVTIVNYCVYQSMRNEDRNDNGTLTERWRNADGTKQYTNNTLKDTKNKKYMPTAKEPEEDVEDNDIPWWEKEDAK